MKRFWTALAVTLLAVFAAAGCNDYGNTFQNPTGAALTSISPSQMPAGSPTFIIKMNGAGFVAQTKVQWNTKTCPVSTTAGTLPSGAVCSTTVTTDTNGNVLSVVATISTSLITKPGLATINTINPASGTGNNGLSNTINFIIGNPPNPVPTVSAVSPTCATVGSGLSLAVTGTNFMNGSTDPTQVSTVIWTLGGSQGQFIAPSSSTSTQITVQVLAGNVNVAGSATVSVSNPPSLPIPNIPGSVGSGGGTSPITSATTVAVQSAPCPVAAKAQSNAASVAAVAEETPAVSRDGRYVAYTAVQNDHAQVFLRDTCEGATAACEPRTSLLSVTNDGSPASSDSHTPSMSADGRYVAFSSDAANLVENAPPGRQIYLRDTCAGTDESCKPSTVLVSTDSQGALIGAESILPSVSSSGRFVAFLAVTRSHAAADSPGETKSSAGATNSGFRQVFIRDTCLGATNCTPKTTRISLQPGDGSGSAPARPALSGQGKHIALAGAGAATLFTRSAPVDDGVFLAITSDQR
jgi:hypothetical protein